MHTPSPPPPPPYPTHPPTHIIHTPRLLLLPSQPNPPTHPPPPHLGHLPVVQPRGARAHLDQHGCRLLRHWRLRRRGGGTRVRPFIHPPTHPSFLLPTHPPTFSYRSQITIHLKEACKEFTHPPTQSTHPPLPIYRSQITIHLKEACKEFAKPARVKEIIKKYSNFVNFPIKVGR